MAYFVEIFLLSAQTDAGAHRFSSVMDTRGFFPRGKAAWTWSWTLTSI